MQKISRRAFALCGAAPGLLEIDFLLNNPPWSFIDLQLNGSEDEPKIAFRRMEQKMLHWETRCRCCNCNHEFSRKRYPQSVRSCGPAPDRPIGSTLADIAIGLGRDHPLHFQGQRPKMLCKQRIQFSLCLVCREVPYQRALSRVGLEFLLVRNHILHPIIPLDGRTPTTVS